MAQAIGQVTFIAGNVKAVDSAGNERVLDINSSVYLGETIVTDGVASRVRVSLESGQNFTLVRNDSITLDSDIYNPNALPAGADTQESIATVESIQEALL
ncbi:MAG: hypothetical protein KAI17_18330, partial [Thiotrichaceae bacterium]|nr:hypothetical protein [Thiotrichaceae bacterium]